MSAGLASDGRGIAGRGIALRGTDGSDGRGTDGRVRIGGIAVSFCERLELGGDVAQPPFQAGDLRLDAVDVTAGR